MQFLNNIFDVKQQVIFADSLSATFELKRNQIIAEMLHKNTTEYFHKKIFLFFSKKIYWIFATSKCIKLKDFKQAYLQISI